MLAANHITITTANECISENKAVEDSIVQGVDWLDALKLAWVSNCFSFIADTLS